MNRAGIADLHVHTTYSDGTAAPAAVLSHAARTGLDVVAITDHDAIAGALEARQLASYFGVDVVVGEEVSTTEGHLLALYIDSYIAPHRSAAATIAEIHAQGGLAIAPHPYDWAVVSLGRFAFAERCQDDWPLDGVEVFNASLTWPRSGANLQALRAATALGLPMTGGSDAHSLATLGSGFTAFDGSTADALREALTSGAIAWGGATWTLRQYLEVAMLSVRQRRLWGAVKLACTDLPFLQRPADQRRATPSDLASPLLLRQPADGHLPI